MGIRFRADHLTCPACEAFITPLNRLKSEHDQVTHILSAAYPEWDPQGTACEGCVNEAFTKLADHGFLSRIKNRLTGREEAGPLHRYRTTEVA